MVIANNTVLIRCLMTRIWLLFVFNTHTDTHTRGKQFTLLLDSPVFTNEPDMWLTCVAAIILYT